MTAATVVQAYRCETCDSVYLQEKKARTCCACTECGGQSPKSLDGIADGSLRDLRHGWTCPRCSYRDDVARATQVVAEKRLDLERRRKELAHAEGALTKLLADGRPAALPGARKRVFAPVAGEKIAS